MNTVTKLSAIAAILASTSSFAMAQGVNVDAGANVGAGVEAGGVSTGTGIDANANANAGSNNGNGNVGASMNADTGASANTSANASGNADVNYGSIISTLRTSNVTSADIEALGVDAQIDIVTLAELQGNAAENSEALEAAVSAQSASLSELTASIEANADVQAALTAEGFTSDQIVAVTSTGEGNLTIVVDDTK